MCDVTTISVYDPTVGLPPTPPAGPDQTTQWVIVTDHQHAGTIARQTEPTFGHSIRIVTVDDAQTVNPDYILTFATGARVQMPDVWNVATPAA